MNDSEEPQPAIALAEDLVETVHAKVIHGLLRHSTRFRLVAVVAHGPEGRDAGVLLDGVARGVPVVPSIDRALELASRPPQVCIVGIATHGGRLTPGLRAGLADAAGRGMSLVNGLHDLAADDPDIAAAAGPRGVSIIDLRRPPPVSELHFWSGAIEKVSARRVAVLGTDCALGKRTTSRFLVEAARAAGLRTEMIYTGQTGWMQGGRYGLVLDSIPNDFVCGELEHALLRCEAEVAPELMILEGQSALRNPSGPCGAELVLAGGARDVVLQHGPGRTYFEGLEELGARIPSVESEVELLAHYGARVIALTLHEEGLEDAALEAERERLERTLGVPVVRPLREGVDRVVAELHRLVRGEGA